MVVVQKPVLYNIICEIYSGGGMVIISDICRIINVVKDGWPVELSFVLKWEK